VDIDVYRGRTHLLYKFNHLPRRFSSARNSLCFCIAAHLPLTASAPSALLITADLPTFMRPCVPTYLELSVSQLAARSFWGSTAAQSCIPKVYHTRENKGLRGDFRQLLFVSPVTRPRCKPDHRGISFASAFATPPSEMPTPCESRGFITNTTLSAYHRGSTTD
jgi:hypothetical protein